MNYTVADNGCWLWTRYIGRSGYAHWTTLIDGKRPLAHRVLYEEHKGPIPNGLVLDHLCRNRACVNPDHLEPVTHQENILRGVAPTADNARKTHCKRGHELVGANLYVYRGLRHCRECRRAWDRGEIQKAVAV